MINHINMAEKLTNALDLEFNFLGFKFGLDPLLGLIPWLGDIITLILSSYMIWIAWKMDLPKHEIQKMVRHITTDFILGLVPIVGDISDFFYKANAKNLKILKKYANTVEGEIISSPKSSLSSHLQEA